jgi:hypothetical protein
MNVGYFSIPRIDGDEFVRMRMLDNQKLMWEGKYVKHVRFIDGLEVLMDGRKRTAIIRSLKEK